ncbi:MAG: hypothetical protein ACPKM0_06205 [Pleomorphochaeta sp.]
MRIFFLNLITLLFSSRNCSKVYFSYTYLLAFRLVPTLDKAFSIAFLLFLLALSAYSLLYIIICFSLIDCIVILPSFKE